MSSFTWKRMTSSWFVQRAHKLKLTLKGGQVRHLWVDAQTFLEVKIEGAPRPMDDKMRCIEIYYRDYKSVNGLMVPGVLETTVEGQAIAQGDHRERCGEPQAG